MGTALVGFIHEGITFFPHNCSNSMKYSRPGEGVAEYRREIITAASKLFPLPLSLFFPRWKVSFGIFLRRHLRPAAGTQSDSFPPPPACTTEHDWQQQSVGGDQSGDITRKIFWEVPSEQEDLHHVCV